MMQPTLVVVNKDRRDDVHRVDEYEAILDAAFVNAPLHTWGVMLMNARRVGTANQSSFL